ncbi:MAG: hypothetical protein HOV81_26655 [Kofleriaceae bacterium]|nr:hypothetical protein [Kofleriaceae bacterium]
MEPLRTKVGVNIRAPWERVADIYGDYQNWQNLFPTIRGVTLLRETDGHVELEIAHDEGRVPNTLTWLAPDRVRLDERKKRYDATFINSFEARGDTTRYNVEAEVRLRGAYRLLRPFIGRLVRRRIEELVLAPVKARAEST